MDLYGSIEAGGTKFVCGIGTGPEDLHVTTIPTSSPEATIAAVTAYLREQGGNSVRAVGIGSFGPVDLNPESPGCGHITSTPKPGWQNFDFAGAIKRELHVPVGFDTDVNAAALGEARWGAAKRLSDFVYLTVGTGIGGGAMVNGALIHGLVHPEMGHVRVPHDWARDTFRGNCPYHEDCLEGLASGPAIEERWGKASSALPPDHPAWTIEAEYLAFALAGWVCTLSPQRIIMGGGVMQQAHLFPMVRRDLSRLLNGYIRASALLEDMDSYVVPPQLGNRSGVLGGLVLAANAAGADTWR